MIHTTQPDKQYQLAAFRVPARKFSYRFLLSLCLCLLILLSLSLRSSSMGIFTLVLINVAFCADVFFRCAWKDLVHLKCSFAVLVSLSVGAGFLYSAFNTFLTKPLAGPVADVYVYISCLLTLALWVQYRSIHLQERTSVFIKKIDDFLPKSGRLCQDNKQRMVFVNELKVGDRIRVNPGERIACDGIILQGNTSIDEQLISGNILPTIKQQGSVVYAGTLNKTAPIEVEVTAGLRSSAIMSVLDAIKQHEFLHNYVPDRLDKAAPWLVASLVLAAGGTYVYVLAMQGWTNWFYNLGFFWIVLALGCPLALLFSSVFPDFFVKKGAAHLGIILNRLAALQTFVKADTIFFDKTGTLTLGTLSIAGVFPAPACNENELMTTLLTIEQKVDGPFAQAVQDYAQTLNLTATTIKSFEVIPGQGVLARTKKDILLAGRKAWLKEQKITIPSLDLGPETVILVAKNGRYLGYVTLIDSLRERAAETVSFLKQEQKEVILISGDTESSVQAVAKQIGIEKTNSNVLPKTKAEIITNLQALGKEVAMVGDGFNDIVALLKADTGILFFSSRNVYNHWVDILIKKDDLFVLADLFKIDSSLHRVVRYNIIMVALLQGLFIIALFWWPDLLARWQAILGISLVGIIFVLLYSMRLLKIR